MLAEFFHLIFFFFKSHNLVFHPQTESYNRLVKHNKQNIHWDVGGGNFALRFDISPVPPHSLLHAGSHTFVLAN